MTVKIRCTECGDEFKSRFMHRAHRVLLHDKRGTAPREWRPGVVAMWIGIGLYLAAAFGIIITTIRGCL